MGRLTARRNGRRRYDLPPPLPPPPLFPGMRSLVCAQHFFSYQAARSGGHWSVVMGNPSDIVGPVLSPHQAHETWQGQIAQILEGNAPGPVVGSNPELSGRPWLFVDVRDVAEAEIRLAESAAVESGERFLLSSGDKIMPQDIGVWVRRFFPDYEPPTALAPPAVPAARLFENQGCHSPLPVSGASGGRRARRRSRATRYGCGYSCGTTRCWARCRGWPSDLSSEPLM